MAITDTAAGLDWQPWGTTGRVAVPDPADLAHRNGSVVTLSGRPGEEVTA